jgi:hypothetical protein
MACVNTKEKSFKELVSKYGASSGTVENAIKIYMDKNNLETYDTNSQDFIDHMDSYFQLKSSNFYSSKGKYNRAHALWEKINPTQNVADIKTATKEYNALVEIFGENNVTVFETSDGGFRVRAAEPIFGDGITSDKKLLKEMSDILSKAPRDKNGNLLAPNGKKSNLTERQYAQVRTKAFKEWFGDWETLAEGHNKKLNLPDKPSGLTDTWIKDNIVEFKGLSTGTKYNIGYSGGRYFIVININGINVPFYKSSGLGGKKNVEAGKWYPFFGISKKGWLNKTTEEEINNYYNSQVLELISNKLDSLFNNEDYGIEIVNGIPVKKGKQANNAIDLNFTDGEKVINKDLNPTENHKDNTVNIVNSNIEKVKRSISYTTLNNKVSKVVDENGEPLVVYHYTDNESLTKFSTEFDNYFSKEGGTKKAIFFTTDNVVPGSEDNFLTNRKAKLALFLNIKNLEEFHGTKEDLHKQGTSYREIVNKSSERAGLENGIVFTGFDDNKKENQTIYVVHNPNQIKSATSNTGAFSKINDRIDDFESNVKVTVEYTPIGKSRQTYTIRGNKIFNKEGKEVFKTDSVDRNKIFANLAVQQGRAVVVNHKNKEYVVNNRNQIISVTTGKMMQWDEKNGDRNAIIKAAQEKFSKNKPSESIQKSASFNWGRTSDNNYEVSSKGDKRFSALNATFKKGTVIDGVDVGGMTIEDVYQKVIKKSGKGKAPAVDSKLNISYRVSTEGITKQYGVVIDKNLKRNYSEWQNANPNGIVAYRVNYSKYNTPEEAQAGRIGNPFSEGIGQANKGEDTVQKFFIWLTTGNNFGNPKATEEYRQAILHKLISTPKGTNILYYTELNRPSHATVLGYLINHKEFITNYKDSAEDFSYTEGYLPLWQEWAKQNPELIEELRTKAAGKTLTDQFANTRVSQARALADILNSTNTKSETIEEAPIFEEENNNMQSAKELVDRMIADSREHIKFNKEDHSYIVDGKKADTSVTQFIHGKKDLGQWGTAASAIGTTADSVTRDFFKGELKDEYPNLSDKDLSFLKHDLKSLRNFFDKKFGKDKYTVVTEEFPIASKYTYTDKDGKLKGGVMAGTMDMLIYDNEGNFYIYDMKTSRSGLNENKVAGYAKQLTLYKAILEANYPELRGKIKELKLIQFRVGYPQPGADFIYSATDGQLYLNNVPIQETEDYYAPHLDFTGNSLDNQVLVPVEPVSMDIHFEGMTEDEVESMREETREPESTEFSQNEVDSQRDNLYGNPLLSATERTFLANNVMSLTSFIVTHLQTNPEANQFYFGDQFSRLNFTKMSREDIISTVGVTKIFEYIKERWYNPDNRTDIDDFDTLDKLQIAYDNWAALVKSAYAKLITLEGVTVVAARPDEISREDIETSFQEQIDAGELEEKEREYWQLGIRNISARSSLSGDIRRSFERLFAIDSNGNPIKDKFGFNFDTFVDSGVAVNSILEWTRTATTVEEMEEILDGMKDSYPWLNSILNKIKEEPFRSQFFQNFRKDFTQYSIVTVERDEKGNKVYQTQIINTKGASQSVLDEITTYYNSGLMQNIIITADGIEGKGRVNVKNVEALKAEKDKIVSDLKGAFTAVRKEVYNNTLKNSVPKITKLLNELGIRVDAKTVSNTIVGKERPKDINNSPVMKLLSEMSYMFDALLSKKDSTSYNPLLKGEEKNIYGNYKSIVGLMSKYIQDSIESSSYENGKMHYSFVTPSYMGKLILNLKDAIGNPSKFNSFMEENYGSYRWFREEDGTWNNAWLELISESKDARQGLEHKVQLSFDGTPYTDLSELGYTLSLMSEYFYDKGSRGKGPQWAWYRVPMLSNKPSSEFIRFKRYSGSEYKRRIKRGLKMVLNQEVLRFRAVLERSVNANIEPISNFDISSKVLKKNPQIEAKMRAGEPLTHDDLVKNGKLITAASGASFKFLEAFNQNIVEGDELGMMLIDKINGVSVNEDSFDKLVNQNLDSYMDIIVSKEISQWEKIGLFDTEEVRRGEDVETRYKYISNLTRSYSTIKKELFGKERRLSKEQKSEIMQVMESEAKANLEEYVWNDMFATINIIQLTATDLAYYKNVEDFQKRYAQVHSPAMRLNITARDSKGRLYSADGMERTMYITDYEVESDIIPNVEEIFDQRISSISDPSEKANMKMMKDLIVDSFRKINVADAQGYSSPTSYRKKMGMMGKWSDEMEEAYNRIKRGDFNVNDLGVVWQPLKPFVYSQIRKPGGSDALSELKVPVQNKNSEYLLLLADALMRGGKKQSKLAAIFDFMEESAYDGRETQFNPKTNTYEVVKEGTYNGKGIDTVQFESSVKSGKSGVVNINKVESYEEIKNILNEATYINSDRTASSDNNNDRYNVNYIHTIPFEDYGIQQEVPAHLVDHEQLMGSQMRILSISDITPGTEFQIGDEHLKSDELISEYQNLIKENIEQSFERLCKDFKVRGTRLERNKALEKILQEAIEKDQRYGADIQRACSLDKNGEFIIPLSDPIQSIRIQQLLNSIIKSRINKQKVTGGPVVQASVFGMSDDLSIRFKDKDGNLIETYSEFVEKRGFSKDKSSAAKYKKFINDKQASVAYFECYMPIPSSELEEALTRYDKDGHAYIISMEEAVKEGIIPEEMRKAIGYRIPTEDKYSMAPLYIKGFLPKAAGEAVMLPKEITLLSGSDFDIDKLYVMLKTFTLKRRTDWGKLEKDILKSSKAKGEERKKRKEALRIVIEQIKAGMEFSEGTFEMAVHDYYYDHRDRYDRASFELSDGGTDRRNNRIFDLQWAVLTNPDTMSKMFNPGSFDVQKKTARIVRILQETKGHTYQELSKLNLDQLDEILDSSTDRNIIYSTSQVYFHKQNMTAGKLLIITPVTHLFLCRE